LSTNCQELKNCSSLSDDSDHNRKLESGNETLQNGKAAKTTGNDEEIVERQNQDKLNAKLDLPRISRERGTIFSVKYRQIKMISKRF
jgi:hypothetical protein